MSLEYADEVEEPPPPPPRKRKPAAPLTEAEIASRIRYVRKLLHDGDYLRLTRDQLLFLGFRCETDEDQVEPDYHGAQGPVYEYWIPPPDPDTLEHADLSKLPGLEHIALPIGYNRVAQDKPSGICIYGSCVEPAVPVHFKDTVYSKMCERDALHYFKLFE